MKMRFMSWLCISPFALVLLGACSGDPGDAGLQADEASISQAQAALSVTSNFRMHNLNKNQGDFCLGVAAGTPNPGVPFITWTCDGSTNQQFQLNTPLVDGLFHLINGVIPNPPPPNIKSVCLDGWNPNNGTQSLLETCVQNFSQGWKATAVGTEVATGFPCFQFSMDGSPNQVLSVLGGNVAKGSKVGMWTNFNNFSSHPDQVWCLQQP